MSRYNWEQFGRFAEVNIKDFESQTEKTFGNEFEIEFEYYKSLDITQEDDSGKIKIYGLSNETINSLQDSGGEVYLRCGYGNNIYLLFHAYVIRVYAQISDSTTVTTIECSSNLLNYYHIGSTESSNSATQGGVSLKQLLDNVARELGGIERVDIGTNEKISSSEASALAEYINTVEVNASFVGTKLELLTSIAISFGLNFSDPEKLDSGKIILNLVFTAFGIELAKKNIAQGYPKVRRTISKQSSAPTDKEKESFVSFSSLYEQDPKTLDYVILDEFTGLISLKPEFKKVRVSEDTPLSSNELETLNSKNKRLNQEIADAKKSKSDEERRKKVEAKGKPFIQGDRKLRTIEVTRRYARVKALLNPVVKPQSMVAIHDPIEISYETKREVFPTAEEDGFDLNENLARIYKIHRVRHATYKGNNKRNDWYMDLYCEDSESNLTDEQLKDELSKLPEGLTEDEYSFDIEE